MEVVAAEGDAERGGAELQEAHGERGVDGFGREERGDEAARAGGGRVGEEVDEHLAQSARRLEGRFTVPYAAAREAASVAPTLTQLAASLAPVVRLARRWAESSGGEPAPLPWGERRGGERVDATAHGVVGRPVVPRGGGEDRIRGLGGRQVLFRAGEADDDE